VQSAIDKAVAAAAGASSPDQFKVPDSDILKMPEDIRSAYNAARKAHYEHEKWALEHTQTICMRLPRP
jgi:hypothetical protein